MAAASGKNDVVVNVSGCVWSSLFLDHASSMGDQEGFLFGEIKKHTSEDISDSQMTRTTEQISINIYSHYACDEPFSFYDRRGHIDQVKLLSMLKDNYKHTLGWYRCRRNTLLEPSLREATIHRELVNTMVSNAPGLFLLGLFTSGIAWNQATHYFNYQLLTLTGRRFNSLVLRVVNLGDTSHSEYRESVAAGTISKGHGIYSSILNDFRGRVVDIEGSLQGVRVIQGISETVFSKMQTLKNKLNQSEQQLQKEMETVRELQRQKREREQREEQLRMEQQAKSAAVRPESPMATSDVDALSLPRAVVHRPTSSGHKKDPSKVLSPTEYHKSPSPKTSPPHSSDSGPIARKSGNGALLGTRTFPESTTSPTLSISTSENEAAPEVAVISPEGSSTDPFAGLFKDMKRSIQKRASFGEESKSSGDGPRSSRAHSWDPPKDANVKNANVKNTPTNTKTWNAENLGGVNRSESPTSSPMKGTTSSPMKGTTSSPMKGTTSSPDSGSQQWNTDSDDATQLPDYPYVQSPTF